MTPPEEAGNNASTQAHTEEKTSEGSDKQTPIISDVVPTAPPRQSNAMVEETRAMVEGA